MQETLNALVTALVLPVLGVITAFVVNYLKVKAYYYNENVSREFYKKYIKIAENVIATAVISVNQVFVDVLKEEGKFTKERQREAFSRCKDIVVKLLSSEAKSALNLMYGDLNAWIDSAIEAQVNMEKGHRLDFIQQ